MNHEGKELHSTYAVTMASTSSDSSGGLTALESG